MTLALPPRPLILDNILGVNDAVLPCAPDIRPGATDWTCATVQSSKSERGVRAIAGQCEPNLESEISPHGRLAHRIAQASPLLAP
jgi:hypothetical protein